MSRRSSHVGVRKYTWRPMRPGPHERRVEALQRHVGRPDEVDLVLARLRRLEPQRDLPDLARHEVHRVQERVQAVGDDALGHRRVVDAVHHHEQRVERQPAAAHARDHHLLDRPRELLVERRVRVAALGLALAEHLLAPRRVLDDDVVREVLEAGLGPVGEAAAAERLPAHADRVDLVDEDDALAAPLGRLLARAPREEADEHSVHPDEGLREAGAWDGHERAVEGRRDRLGEHRLAGARRAEEHDAALALAAGLDELLARLPEGDDAGDLLARLLLAADVAELDAPVRVTWLVDLDLLGAEEQQRAEQDQEVGEEEDQDDRQVAERDGRERGHRVAERVDAGADRPRLAADDVDRHRHGDQDAEEDEEPDDAAVLLAPVPEAPPRDDVVALELLLGAVERRARDEHVGDDVDQSAEGGDREDRQDDRDAERQIGRPVEQREEDGARDDRDRGRHAIQPAPLVGQGERLRDTLPAGGGGKLLGQGSRG